MNISFFKRNRQEDLPDIQIHRTTEGTVFEIISLLLVVAMWGLIFWLYRRGIYETIIVGVVGTFTAAYELYCCYHPRLLRRNFKMKTVRHYILAIRMLRIVTIELLLMMIGIILDMSGRWQDSAVTHLLPIIFMVVLVTTYLIFMVQMPKR